MKGNPGVAADAWIEVWVRQLSLADRVGQLLCVEFAEPYLSAQARRLIREARPGGVILFGNNIADPSQLRDLIRDLQAYAAECGLPPLFVGVDQEGGVVSRLKAPATRLPSAMAIGATGRPDLAADWAGVTAREFLALGLNLNFAPVLDVNSNPSNPVIGIRSFGESPGLVADLGRAAIRAYLEHGVIAVGKHFPGHGDTALDSHLALPFVDRNWDRLAEVELPPFIAAIEAGAQALMTAHVLFPAVDPSGLPATLSPRLLTGLLRNQLAFEGLIVTDAMVMGAIANRYGLGDAALLSIQAGADLLLPLGHPDDQAALAADLVRAVSSRGITLARLEASLRRILRLKAPLARRIQTGGRSLPSDRLDRWPVDAHAETARALARASTTLVRNDGTLPFRLDGSARLGLVEFTPIRFSPIENKSEAVPSFAHFLRNHHANLEAIALDAEVDGSGALDLAHRCDALVVATRNAHLLAGQAGLVRRLLATEKPTAVVALRNPYDLQAFPDAGCYLATYGDPACSLEAAADLLFGLATPSGRLPVGLPGLYDAGHGLGWQ